VESTPAEPALATSPRRRSRLLQPLGHSLIIWRIPLLDFFWDFFLIEMSVAQKKIQKKIGMSKAPKNKNDRSSFERSSFLALSEAHSSPCEARSANCLGASCPPGAVYPSCNVGTDSNPVCRKSCSTNLQKTRSRKNSPREPPPKTRAQSPKHAHLVPPHEF
jgi:hypothetical protein